jgi:hypothetical protein
MLLRVLFIPLIFCIGVAGCSSTVWEKDDFSDYENIDIAINTSKEEYSTEDTQLEITIKNHTPIEIHFRPKNHGCRIEKLIDEQWYYLNDSLESEVSPAISGGLTPGDSLTFSMPMLGVTGKGDYRVCFKYFYDEEDDDKIVTRTGVAYSYFCVQ